MAQPRKKCMFDIPQGWQRWFSFCGRPPWGLGVERFHLRGMMSSSGRKECMQYLVKPGKEISGAYRMLVWIPVWCEGWSFWRALVSLHQSAGHRGTALGIWIVNTTSVATLLPRHDMTVAIPLVVRPARHMHLLRPSCTLYNDKMWSINLYTM